MGCSKLKRPCSDFPRDVTLLNVSGVTATSDSIGVVVRWDENEDSGATHVAVVDMVSGERVAYTISPYLAPSSSAYIALASEGVYGISYWKEDGLYRSDIGVIEHSHLTDPDAIPVVHNTIEVSQLTELVVHTRQQIYLVQEGTVSDYLLTEQLGITISG